MARKNIVLNFIMDEPALQAMERLAASEGISRSALVRKLMMKESAANGVSAGPSSSSELDQFLREIERI